MVSIIQKYYIKVIVPDLINKFGYDTLTKIPRLKKIILNFGDSSMELKELTSALLALELITVKKSKLTFSSKANLMLKIRKGSPVGCKVVLTGDLMYYFIFKLISEVFPRIKDFTPIRISKKLNSNSFSFSLHDLASFKELSKQFYFFSKLPPLNIVCFLNTTTNSEFIYLLKSFKFPLTS